MKLAGWGNHPAIDCRTLDVRGTAAIGAAVAAEPTLIARGNGRAYGDAALNAGATLRTRRHDRLLAFDPRSGTIDCQSGVLLDDLVTLFLPRGWIVPVVPGTRFVTVGGMVASDVHGKNHHRDGSFGRHVLSIDLVRGDGTAQRCSRDHDPELFAATCGGMGLTGVIDSVRFRMIRIATAWMRQETIRTGTLRETFAAFEASDAWTYSVAWIDCLATGPALGRSVLTRAEHARPPELPPAAAAQPLVLPPRRRLSVPLTPPAGLVNGATVRAFNALYWHRARPGRALVPYDRYFFPLDAVAGWNRIYGNRGFLQYQCVLPERGSAVGIAALLGELSRAGLGSFLAVLKRLGPAAEGPLSFPIPGYTLALDFPVTARLGPLLERMDAIVSDHQGRIYLAKDARMPRALVESGYRQLPQFRSLRAERGLTGKFRSALSDRLGL